MFSSSVASLVRQNEPLAPFCWLRIGGSARYFAEVEDQSTLQSLCHEAHERGIPVRILGGGSNLLVRPGTVDALVIRLSGEFQQIEIDETTIQAGSAAALGDLTTAAAQKGLSGLEQLAGIPGTVGGAVLCNSGVKNDDIGSHVQNVEAVSRDGEISRLDREALKFSFRRSNLEDQVLCSVTLKLEQLDSEEVTRRLQANWIIKKAAQPSPDSRVAQLFVEPAGYRIVDLLEAAGMRSASEGGAAMHSQFPGFVQVNENATANEVLALSNRIMRAVEVQSGIQLRCQLRIW